MICMKMEDFSNDIKGDVEKWFDTPNYEVERPLPIKKNLVRLMKDELSRDIRK